MPSKLAMSVMDEALRLGLPSCCFAPSMMDAAFRAKMSLASSLLQYLSAGASSGRHRMQGRKPAASACSNRKETAMLLFWCLNPANGATVNPRAANAYKKIAIKC